MIKFFLHVVNFMESALYVTLGVLRVTRCHYACRNTDDIFLVSASNNRTESRTTLQEGVNIVQKWSRWTRYTISHSKSKILPMCKSKYHTLKLMPYINSIIPNTRTADIVGGTFNRHLTFKAHTTRVKKEANNLINLFRMLGTGQSRHKWLAKKKKKKSLSI